VLHSTTLIKKTDGTVSRVLLPVQNTGITIYPKRRLPCAFSDLPAV